MLSYNYFLSSITTLTKFTQVTNRQKQELSEIIIICYTKQSYEIVGLINQYFLLCWENVQFWMFLLFCCLQTKTYRAIQYTVWWKQPREIFTKRKLRKILKDHITSFSIADVLGNLQMYCFYELIGYYRFCMFLIWSNRIFIVFFSFHQLFPMMIYATVGDTELGFINSIGIR